MVDVAWLSDQARTIHDLFVHIFYGLATVLLVLGVVIEFFKLPIGGSGSVTQLVGRTIIAAILLHTYPEVCNAIAGVTDALAKELGDLNQIKLVLAKFSEKFHTLSRSWISIKDWAIMIISYLLFFLLYLSVFIANAGIIFGWTILYVFSPLLIVLYILPATSQATTTLYRSLFELSAWKIVWSVLATLLWSFALSTINRPENDTNFITVLVLNFILAASLLLTPSVVHALTSKGISGISEQLGGVGAAASLMNPGARVASAARWADNTFGTGVAKRSATNKSNELKDHVKAKLFPSKPAKKPRAAVRSMSAQSPRKDKMPEAPAWVKQAPPNTEEPPPWMQSRLKKEKHWDRQKK